MHYTDGQNCSVMLLTDSKTGVKTGNIENIFNKKFDSHFVLFVKCDIQV
jgi:hypothetical protein